MIVRFAPEIELDTETFELRAHGQATTLGAKPFGVLLYLVERRERVVPREELLAAVWPGIAVTESSLTQCIHQLRKLLRPSGDDPAVIATVYGRGYRFVGELAGIDALSETNGALPAAVTERERSVTGFGDRPAIAVLPFASRSGDEREAHFADAIADDLIERIASYRWFPVIARGTSFAFRGAEVDVRKVGRELGIRYAIEGAVHREHDQVRVRAALVDAISGEVVSQQRRQGRLADVFALQEEIAGELVAALEPDLHRREIERALRTPPRDLEAWGLFMRGTWHLLRYTREENARARALFDEASAREPGFASPLAFAALSHLNDANAGWSEAPRQSIATALELAERCARLDPRDPWGQAILGGMYAVLGRRQAAIDALSLALERNPSFPLACWALGRGLSIWNRAAEAIELFHRAIRLSPRDPMVAHFLEGLAFAHYFCDDLDEAVSYAQQSARERPDWPRTHMLLAAALARLDRAHEAEQALARMRALRAEYDISQVAGSYRLANAEPGVVERLIEGLRAAGLV